MTSRKLHRMCTVPVAAFALVHLANHFVSLFSIPAHLAFMDAARAIYRQPAVEALLLLAVAGQVGSGATLVIRRWIRQRGWLVWLQTVSGICLGGFLCVHVGAVLVGRFVLRLDTNFYYAAAGFHVPPFQFVFAPYYFLGVLVLFTHLGCAAARRFSPVAPRQRLLVVALFSLVGGVLALLICLSLAGKLQPVRVPASYLSTYPRGNAAR